MSELDDLGSLDDMGSLDDLGDLEEISFDEDPGPAAAPQPAAPAQAIPQAAASGLGTVIQDLIAKRNFQQVIQIAENQKEAVAGDPQVQALVEKAQAELEKDAYIKSFLDGARKAMAAGQRDKAKEFFDKARSLEPGHPAVAAFVEEMQSRTQAVPSPEPAAPQPAAPQPAAPQPATPQPATPAPEPSTQPAPAPSPAETHPMKAQQPVAASPEPPPAAPVPAAPVPTTPEPTAPAPVAPAPAAREPAIPASAPAEAEPEMLSFDEAEPLDLDGDFDDSSFGDSDFGDSDFGDSDFGDDAFAPEPAAPQPAGHAAPVAEALDGDFGDLDGDLDVGGLDLDSLDGDLEGLGGGDDLESLGVVDTEAELDEDQSAKIRELLAEGQGHFEADRLQDAIDVWSRIFLIDIDNGDASDRIEKARQRKAEKERQAEEIFHQATEQIESHDLEGAQASLRQVLELQPNHPTAEDYLQQLAAGQVPAIKRQAEADSELDLLDDAGLGDLASASTETGRDMDAAVARDRVVLTQKRDMKMIVLGGAVGVVVLLLLVLLVTQWSTLFPNADDEQAASAAMSPLLERAKRMHGAGKVEDAILVLEGMPAQDVGYSEAQVLLAQWRAEVAPPEVEEDTGPTPAELRRRSAFLDAARRAQETGEMIRASLYLSRAREIQELDEEEQQVEAAIDRGLKPVQPLLDQFKRGEYVQIVPQLWRMREEQPDNPDVRRLLIDSYYNLALDDLQKGLPADAGSKLKDILEVDPENEDLQRLQSFAQTYTNRGEDLLYRIFVKYTPRRKYD